MEIPQPHWAPAAGPHHFPFFLFPRYLQQSHKYTTGAQTRPVCYPLDQAAFGDAPEGKIRRTALLRLLSTSMQSTMWGKSAVIQGQMLSTSKSNSSKIHEPSAWLCRFPSVDDVTYIRKSSLKQRRNITLIYSKYIIFNAVT